MGTLRAQLDASFDSSSPAYMLGTVGYGDVTPAAPAARSLSLIEAVVGIMYVATMIARFVSIQTSNDSRNAKPDPE